MSLIGIVAGVLLFGGVVSAINETEKRTCRKCGGNQLKQIDGTSYSTRVRCKKCGHSWWFTD